MKQELEKYFDRLWPICRSITGNGLRESFHILQELIPLQLEEIPSGTPVFDWEIPDEWNINDAYILAPDGSRICEFRKNNLHVVNYSMPIDREMEYDELVKYIYTLPKQPDTIPYITSYYKRNWGFCMPHALFSKLPQKGKYKVHIDSSLQKGSLTYGHLVLPGETDEEILFSTYLCHPSMANNELSGPLALAFLYKELAKLPKRKYTYRFVVAPETIGVIAYLAKYGTAIGKKIRAGYVLTCCGNEAPFVYKRSKQGISIADKAAEHVLRYGSTPFSIIDFAIGGSDERQYCSPGFNWPVGSLTRSMYRTYPEYHTSLDNKSFISFEALEKTIETYFNIARALEMNERYTNKIPYCEPQLGKRNMYPGEAGWIKAGDHLYNLLHFLSFADGSIDLIDISEKRSKSIFDFEAVIRECKDKGLI